MLVQGVFGGGSTPPPMNFLVVDTVFNAANPNFVCWARRVPSVAPITGITRIYTESNLAGGIDFRGTVTPFLPDPNGTAGANPAHIIWQFLFEEDPHGLGLPQGPWDLASLEQLGIDYGEAGEGLRAHLKLDQRVPAKQALSELCNDIGIEVAWNPVTGKYSFKKRREETPFAVVPREMLAEDLISSSRRLESDPGRSFVFTWEQAKDSYSKGSLEVDDLGNINETARAGAEVINMNSIRDYTMALKLASYRAAYEISRGAVVNMKLKNDAATLMAGDVIDVEAVTDNPIPFRLISTERKPLSSVVDFTGFFDHFNIEDAFGSGIQGISQFIPRVPEEALPDFATIAYQQLDGTYLFLRIPSMAETLFAVLQVTDDGISYWSIGTVPACVGGAILEDMDATIDLEDGFVFQQPAGLFAENLPQLPSAAAEAGVLRLITEEREVIYFRELESYGDNVWRVKGMLRAKESTTAEPLTAGQKIWIWHNGKMPSFENNLPTTGTPGYKLVPYTYRRIADPSSIGSDPV
jgi:hypothetical protein